MKQQIILWIGALLLLTGGAGCEKEELNPDSAIEKILSLHFTISNA